MNRRDFLATSSAALATSALAVPALAQQPDPHKSDTSSVDMPAWKPSGKLKHSACRWCYGNMPLDELCAYAASIGMHSIELLNPDEFGTAKKHGLTCAVASFVKANPIPRGLNRLEHHDSIIKELEERLPIVKEAGIPCQIVFSGNRAGQDDKEGIQNCITGLKRITPLAEKLGITLVMELLNSKDHKDYQCDHTSYGVAICEGLGTDRFKLLYDIYHMQRMEGDVIDTIQKNIKHIAHFHTGGVPGRAEIDESQELNYRKIMQAIADTGYAGFIGQEFIPRKDPKASLRAAVQLCDV